MATRKRRSGGGGSIKPARQLLSMNAYITNGATAALAGADKEDAAALRTALLTCIVLLQEHEDPAVQNFCTKLITEFPPISARFQRHKQPWLGRIEVLRARMQDGTIKILLPEDGVRELAGLDG